MTAFFKVTRAPADSRLALEFIEVEDSGAVTRSVVEGLDGELLANTIASAAHRSGAFADFADTARHPSLWPDQLHADDNRNWRANGCLLEPVTRKEFEHLFRRARINV